jgi:hypothetical protein
LGYQGTVNKQCGAADDARGTTPHEIVANRAVFSMD